MEGMGNRNDNCARIRLKSTRVVDNEDKWHTGGYPLPLEGKERCFIKSTYHDASRHWQEGMGDVIDENGQYHGKEQSSSTAHEWQHCVGGRGGEYWVGRSEFLLEL